MMKDLIFKTKSDAETVIVDLKECLETYGVVSLADLYDIVGVNVNKYDNYLYGWVNLDDASVIELPDGYFVKLPEVIDIRGI